MSLASALAPAIRTRRLHTGARPDLPRLILMTDRRRQPDPQAAINRLPRGSAVILRDYDDLDRAALARQYRQWTGQSGISLLIAGDAALAATVGADGLHLPEYMLPRAAVLRRHHPGWLITCAAHSATALRRASATGLDAALLSPVFPTRSHPGAPVLGAYRHAALRKSAPDLPVFALGGVNVDTIGRLLPGLQGWAAIDGI